MNRRTALAALALLASVSFAHADDDFILLLGNYTEPTGGNATIRLADEAKMEAGPLRFMLLNGSTQGDWQISHGTTDGGEDYFEFMDGIFKGTRYDIVYGDAETVQLVEVGGNNTTWTHVRTP